MNRFPHHFRFMFLAVVCLIVLASGLARARNEQENMQDLAKKELQRRQKISEWVREKKPSPQEHMLKIYEPIILGNQSDFEKNMKLAQRFRERAQDSMDKNMVESARKFAVVSKLFFDYSQINKEIVLAIKNREGEKLDAAFGKVKDIEQKILNITEKQVEREWFTPEELAAAAKALAEERAAEKKRQQQKKGGESKDTER